MDSRRGSLPALVSSHDFEEWHSPSVGTTSLDGSVVVDVSLGGTCEDGAIPILLRHELSYKGLDSPGGDAEDDAHRVTNASNEDENADHLAPRSPVSPRHTNARRHLLIIDSVSPGLTAMVEASDLIACRGRHVVLVVQPLKPAFGASTERVQLNAARAALAELAKQHNVKVFDTVEKAVSAIKRSVQGDHRVSASKHSEGSWEFSWEGAESPLDDDAMNDHDVRIHTHQLDGEIAARQRELKELQRRGFAKVTSSDKDLMVQLKSDIIRLSKEKKKRQSLNQHRRPISNGGGPKPSPIRARAPSMWGQLSTEGRLRLAPSHADFYRALVEAPALIVHGQVMALVLEPLDDSQCAGVAIDDLEQAYTYVTTVAERQGVRVFGSEAVAEAVAKGETEAASDIKADAEATGALSGTAVADSFINLVHQPESEESHSVQTDSPDVTARSSSNKSLSIHTTDDPADLELMALCGRRGSGASGARVRPHSTSFDTSEAGSGFTSIDDGGGTTAIPGTPTSDSTLRSQLTAASTPPSPAGGVGGTGPTARILTERHSLDQEIQRRERELKDIQRQKFGKKVHGNHDRDREVMMRLKSELVKMKRLKQRLDREVRRMSERSAAAEQTSAMSETASADGRSLSLKSTASGWTNQRTRRASAPVLGLDAISVTSSTSAWSKDESGDPRLLSSRRSPSSPGSELGADNRFSSRALACPSSDVHESRSLSVSPAMSSRNLGSASPIRGAHSLGCKDKVATGQAESDATCGETLQAEAVATTMAVSTTTATATATAPTATAMTAIGSLRDQAVIEEAGVTAADEATCEQLGKLSSELDSVREQYTSLSDDHAIITSLFGRSRKRMERLQEDLETERMNKSDLETQLLEMYDDEDRFRLEIDELTHELLAKDDECEYLGQTVVSLNAHLKQLVDHSSQLVELKKQASSYVQGEQEVTSAANGDATDSTAATIVNVGSAPNLKPGQDKEALERLAAEAAENAEKATRLEKELEEQSQALAKRSAAIEREMEIMREHARSITAGVALASSASTATTREARTGSGVSVGYERRVAELEAEVAALKEERKRTADDSTKAASDARVAELEAQVARLRARQQRLSDADSTEAFLPRSSPRRERLSYDPAELSSRRERHSYDPAEARRLEDEWWSGRASDSGGGRGLRVGSLKAIISPPSSPTQSPNCAMDEHVTTTTTGSHVVKEMAKPAGVSVAMAMKEAIKDASEVLGETESEAETEARLETRGSARREDYETCSLLDTGEIATANLQAEETAKAAFAAEVAALGAKLKKADDLRAAAESELARVKKGARESQAALLEKEAEFVELLEEKRREEKSERKAERQRATEEIERIKKEASAKEIDNARETQAKMAALEAQADSAAEKLAAFESDVSKRVDVAVKLAVKETEATMVQLHTMSSAEMKDEIQTKFTADVELIEQAKCVLEMKLKASVTELEEQRAETISLAADKAAIEDRVVRLEAQLATVDADKVKLADALASAESQASKMQLQSNCAAEAKAQLDEQVSSLTERLTATSEAATASAAVYVEAKSRLGAELESAQTAVARLEAEAASAEEERARFEAESAALTQQLQEEASALEGRLGVLTAERDALATQHQARLDEREALERQLDLAQSECTANASAKLQLELDSAKRMAELGAQLSAHEEEAVSSESRLSQALATAHASVSELQAREAKLQLNLSVAEAHGERQTEAEARLVATHASTCAVHVRSSEELEAKLKAAHNERLDALANLASEAEVAQEAVLLQKAEAAERATAENAAEMAKEIAAEAMARAERAERAATEANVAAEALVATEAAELTRLRGTLAEATTSLKEREAKMNALSAQEDDGSVRAHLQIQVGMLEAQLSERDAAVASTAVATEEASAALDEALRRAEKAEADRENSEHAWASERLRVNRRWVGGTLAVGTTAAATMLLLFVASGGMDRAPALPVPAASPPTATDPAQNDRLGKAQARAAQLQHELNVQTERARTWQQEQARMAQRYSEMEARTASAIEAAAVEKDEFQLRAKHLTGQVETLQQDLARAHAQTQRNAQQTEAVMKAAAAGPKHQIPVPVKHPSESRRRFDALTHVRRHPADMQCPVRAWYEVYDFEDHPDSGHHVKLGGEIHAISHDESDAETLPELSSPDEPRRRRWWRRRGGRVQQLAQSDTSDEPVPCAHIAGSWACSIDAAVLTGPEHHAA